MNKQIKKLPDYEIPESGIPNLHYYFKLFTDKINELIEENNNAT